MYSSVESCWSFRTLRLHSMQTTRIHIPKHGNLRSSGYLAMLFQINIKTAEIKYMGRTSGYIRTDCNKYTNCRGIKNNTNLDKLLEYKRNWIQHVNRMPRNRLPRVVKHYSPTGRRNHGTPLKRLLDTWDRNESTSGPTPWQIYDDDNNVSN